MSLSLFYPIIHTMQDQRLMQRQRLHFFLNSLNTG